MNIFWCNSSKKPHKLLGVWDLGMDSTFHFLPRLGVFLKEYNSARFLSFAVGGQWVCRAFRWHTMLFDTYVRTHLIYLDTHIYPSPCKCTCVLFWHVLCTYIYLFEFSLPWHVSKIRKQIVKFAFCFDDSWVFYRGGSEGGKARKPGIWLTLKIDAWGSHPIRKTKNIHIKIDDHNPYKIVWSSIIPYELRSRKKIVEKSGIQFLCGESIQMFTWGLCIPTGCPNSFASGFPASMHGSWPIQPRLRILKTEWWWLFRACVNIAVHVHPEHCEQISLFEKHFFKWFALGWTMAIP